MAARNLCQNCGVCAAVSVWRLAGPKLAWHRETEEISDKITTSLSFYSRTYAVELRHIFARINLSTPWAQKYSKALSATSKS